MTSKVIIVDPSNVVTDGWGDGLTGVGPFTITATPGDDLAHRASLQSSANLSSITMTLTGTDANDDAQTEAVTGPNNNTVESSKYFKTLTLITASATLGGNTMDVGWVDEVVSPTIILNAGFPSNWHLDVTGTISMDTDWLVKDPSLPPATTNQNDEPWLDGAQVQSSLDGETADSALAIVVAEGYNAMRVRINSYNSTAQVILYMTQRS